jgi:hypothetical protein
MILTLGLNLWFWLYFSLLQPPLLARLRLIPEQPDLSLGGLLILAIGLETVGMWLKFPKLMARLGTHIELSMVGAFITAATVMGHMGMVTGLLSFRVISAFGIDLDGSPPLIPGLLAVVFFYRHADQRGHSLGLCARCIQTLAHIREYLVTPHLCADLPTPFQA